jgi:hypothetical protein
MQIAEAQREHRWLQRLVGEWVVEGECNMGPDQPPMKTTGKETVRSFGRLWIIGEGSGDTPDGSCDSMMTLGYNPQTKRFVGTFIASAMTHLWPYNGSLDSADKALTLDSEGPSFTGAGMMVKYQDIIEFINDDYRTLTSQVLGEDGQWQPFMKAHYRRNTTKHRP